MIITELNGGFGNQLFQYAIGKQLAVQHHTQLLLDKTWLASQAGAAVFPFQAIDPDVTIAPRQLVEPFAITAGRWQRIVRRVINTYRPHPIAFIRERYPYRNVSSPTPVPCYLTGYWQHPGYFTAISDWLRTSLQTQLRPYIPSGFHVDGQTVCLHVRRGDYVINRRYHTLPAHYYARALQLLKTRVGPVQVYIFSDEPDWCRQHLSFTGPVWFLSARSRPGSSGSNELLQSLHYSQQYIQLVGVVDWPENRQLYHYAPVLATPQRSPCRSAGLNPTLLNYTLLMTIITIGLPFYNQATYLSAAIRSVVNQSFTDWELLLLNDGSTDDSLAVAYRWLADPRIRLITDTKRLGLASRLNQIARLAEGRFLARMDADDLMAPNRLQTQLRYLLENPQTDLTASFAYIIDRQTRICGLRGLPAQSPRYHKLLTRCPIIHPTVMARTDWFRRPPV